jgi:CheY-like chemotaxis protein
MQTSNLKFISQFNSLKELAVKNAPHFAEQFCEFICEEFQFLSSALFKVNENNKLVLTGKSGSAAKTLLPNGIYDCTACKFLKQEPANFEFYSEHACEIRIAEQQANECCVWLKTGTGEKYLLKVSQRTPITAAERQFFQITGNFLLSILEFWGGTQNASGFSFSKFIAEAANDLRTPTNSIMGFASLLGDEKLTPAQAEYTATLRENSQKLLSLINDLVDFAKAESGILPVNALAANIGAIVDDVFSQVSGKSLNGVIQFEKLIDKNIPESVKADTLKLKFILQQFVSFLANVTESGKILISITAPLPNKLQFRVSNSGSIIPLQNLPKYFTGEQVLDTKSFKNSPLSILSLPLSRKYIEMLGGAFDVVYSPMRGIAINFNIPLDSISPLESKILAIPKEPGKNKVLVIEDDYATSKLLSNYLNKWGYEPMIINSGIKALQLLQSEKFLAVIMDIVLPDVNGLELLKKIREDEHSKYTPVIVCSVEAEQQKAFMMGAVEYFVKPIRYKDLVEVLTSYKLKKDSTILCVDDDVPTLNLVKSAIESVGLTAIAEAHSTKVMDRIKDAQLDLAIIDLDMPEINGFQLIKLIKSTTKFANLPIIIYTGKENYEEDLRNIDGLFTELLSKRSTKLEDLAETINSMINRYEQPTAPEEVKVQTDAPKVLLVEDYKHSQIIVTRLLKKNGFTSVVVVENGAEALEQVKQQSFDIILMDMQMPVMNGFEATERIRQIPEYKDTPIIALTAFAMKGDKEKCLEAGASDYIPKPIDSQEFIEKVKRYTSLKMQS